MAESKQQVLPVQVLVVGGGPGGMTMAHELHRYGIGARVIDKHTSEELAKLLHHTRAISFFPLTADIFQTMGVWPDMRERHFPIHSVRLYYNGVDPNNNVLAVPISDIPAECFPTKTRALGWSMSQNEITDLIEKRLEKVGVKTELGVELKEFTETQDGVDCVLQHRSGQTEQLHVAYVIACDGFHSPIREKLGIRYDGFTYESDYGLMDAKRPVWKHSQERANDYCFYVSPNQYTVADTPFQDGRTRMMLIRHNNKVKQQQDELPASFPKAWKDIGITPATAVDKFDEIGCYSVFRVHNKCAAKWRSTPAKSKEKKADKDKRGGRVLLVGDAAHNVSPAFGQGMNLAIQDAHNLAWKVTLVLNNKAKDTILDTYQPERVRVWKHASFTSKMVEDSMWMSRRFLLRNMMKNVTKLKSARSMFCQAGVGYKSPYTSSPLSRSAGAPRGSIAPGLKMHLNNKDGKSVLDFTVVLPTRLCAAAYITVPSAPTQELRYRPADEDLLAQNWTSFLVELWGTVPGAYHSLYIFDTASSKGNALATAAAEKLGAFVHVYHVVAPPSSSKSTSPSTASPVSPVSHMSPTASAPSSTPSSPLTGTASPRSETDTPHMALEVRTLAAEAEAGFAVIVDHDLRLHRLMGMLRGGIVLVRPDEYAAFVSGDVSAKQVTDKDSPLARYLRQFYTVL